MFNRRAWFLGLVLLFILFPFITAGEVDFKLAKATYKPLETFQSDIRVNVPLSKDLAISNIKLTDSNGNNVELAKRLIKLNASEYYTYFDLPKLSDGIYTVGVYDIYYGVGSGTKKGSFTVNFNVISSTEDVLSINPAFVLSRVFDYDETPFTLTIKNLGQNNLDVNIETDWDFLSVQQKSFSLVSGGSKSVTVNTLLYNKEGNHFSGELFVKYSDLQYIIPINVERTLTEQKVQPNMTNITKPVKPVENITTAKKAILVLGDAYGNSLGDNITLIVSRGGKFEYSLTSNSDLVVHDIHVVINGDAKEIAAISKDKVKTISSYGIIPLDLEIKDLDKNYSGKIVVTSKDAKNFEIPIYIYYQPSKIIEDKNETVVSNQTMVDTQFGDSKQKKGSNAFMWILILIVILLIIFLIYYLYKRSKPKREEFEEFIEKARSRR